jgi:perosamine synthetase
MVMQRDLAIYGGVPVRSKPFPPRMLFDEDVLEVVKEVFLDSWDTEVDFGYQGKYEAAYCRLFSDFQGGGYADVVCTGTVAVYLAVAALELPVGSEVVVSPITDPGTINAIIFNRFIPVVADSMPGSYNVGPEQIRERLTDKTKAIVVVHAAGQAAPIEAIAQIAKERGIALVEDCSQAHGATYNGKKVGTFGDIAAFSTMYRKGHATGASGGVVFTRNEELYRLVRAYADRGKPFWSDDFDEKDPTTFLFPALNLHSDELSCAIGAETLGKLPGTNVARIDFLRRLSEALKTRVQSCSPYPISGEDAPFFFPTFVKMEGLVCTKIEYANALRAEGIPLNPHYKYVVCEWPWALTYLSDDFVCDNAIDCRDRSFNFLINERYGDDEIEDIVAAVQKVDRVYYQ